MSAKAEHRVLTEEELEVEQAKEVQTQYPIPLESLSDEALQSLEAQGLLDQELNAIANSGNGVSHIPVPRAIGRRKMADTFHDTFELIGGVPRFAQWADRNQTEFYKLFARMIPTEAHASVNHTGEFVVKHVVPKGKLDV
jgi:hypothetical protein